MGLNLIFWVLNLQSLCFVDLCSCWVLNLLFLGLVFISVFNFFYLVRINILIFLI